MPEWVLMLNGIRRERAATGRARILLLTVACLLALWPAFATAQTEDEFEDLP